MGDTLITYAGVMRCCIATVGKEYDGKNVSVGARSKCEHCYYEFELVLKPSNEVSVGVGSKKLRPIWMPLWQLTPEWISTRKKLEEYES